MIKPDSRTIEELIILLRPIMETEEDRKALLFRAFGNSNSLREQIDCIGSMITFIPKLLDRLANYGEIESGKEALCVFLETIQQQELVGLEKQEQINKLLRQFERSSFLQAEYFQGKGSKYQDLSNITVGIRSSTNSVVMGTGIIVKKKILTLGRVITSLGYLPEGKVNVYLPRTNRGSSRAQQAIIECSFPEREHHPQDDDIMVLSLVNGASANKTARLESANQSTGNPFHIYGFTGLNELPSDYIKGEIIGSIECPIEVDPQINCLKLLREDNIYPAMAGSAVLDLTRNFIVGLLVRPMYSNGSSMAFDGDTINLELLHNVLNQEPM